MQVGREGRNKVEKGVGGRIPKKKEGRERDLGRVCDCGDISLYYHTWTELLKACKKDSDLVVGNCRSLHSVDRCSLELCSR